MFIVADLVSLSHHRHTSEPMMTPKTYQLDERYVFDRHRSYMAVKLGEFVKENHDKLPTLYWLPKLHKRP